MMQQYVRTTTSAMEQRGDERRRSSCAASGQATQIILRLLSLGSMGVAWAIMFFSEETEVIGGRASYRVSPVLMFFVYATGVTCLYCMATIPMVFYFYKNRFVFVLDMAVMALAMACASAVTAVGYVAEFGNETLGWFGVCSLYKSYCSRAIISVAFSYLGFICLFLICVICALSPAHPPLTSAAEAARSPCPSAPLSA